MDIKKTYQEKIEDYYNHKPSGGYPVDTLISALKADGFSIIEAMQALRDLCHLSLKDAKHIVGSHRVYIQEAQRSETFHEEIIDIKNK